MKDGIEKYTKHYYTGNHLSSTQLVTDGTGVVVQQVEYAPFGEVVNEYNIDWSNGQVPDFKFNAKELDEENGMYYFEARYHAPPSFISRDVLFEEKPWMSPYVYCSNSPLTRIDPSGMLDGDYYDEKGVYLGSDGIDDGKIYVVPNSEEAKQISAADDKCMTTPVNSVNSAVELPSLSIRQEMSTVIDMDAKDPYREYGGSIFGDANGETFVAWANPGERFTPNDEYANIDLNNYQNPTQIYKATTLISTFHSHPSGEIDGYGVSQVPSAADINNAKQRTSFIGNHYLFGAKSGKVSIYDKNGVKATFPVELFRALGK